MVERLRVEAEEREARRRRAPQLAVIWREAAQKQEDAVEREGDGAAEDDDSVRADAEGEGDVERESRSRNQVRQA